MLETLRSPPTPWTPVRPLRPPVSPAQRAREVLRVTARAWGLALVERCS